MSTTKRLSRIFHPRPMPTSVRDIHRFTVCCNCQGPIGDASLTGLSMRLPMIGEPPERVPARPRVALGLQCPTCTQLNHVLTDLPLDHTIGLVSQLYRDNARLITTLQRGDRTWLTPR